MSRMFRLLLVLALLSGGLAKLTPQPVQAADTAIQETPTGVVTGGVTSYTLAAPKIFWHTSVPLCPPAVAAAEAPDAPAAPEGPTALTHIESIRRIATYGSMERQLYAVDRDCDEGQILSNLAAGVDYLYWLGDDALRKLSTDANPGDPSQLVNALVQGPGEVVNSSDRVYMIHNNTGGSNTKIAYVLKSNNQRVSLSTPGNVAYNLSYDGEYVYYLVGSNLVRLEPGVDSGQVIATGVSGYYAEGRRLTFCTINPVQCHFSRNVYVAKGDQIFIYNNNNDTLGAAIYTSVDDTASIFDLVTDFGKLYFFESRTIPCSPDPCFPSYSYVLQRSGRGGGAADALFTHGPTAFIPLANLTTDGTFLFWQQGETVQRLPNDAAALPQVNMRVTGMEITQGIQNPNNSVLLVKNRRTFVRLYVKSDGVAVSGVGASLIAPDLGDNPLQPVNPAGTHITVRQNPNRNDIDQSFLFELPWSWTEEDSLNLEATLNPYKVPLEPNYNDNGSSITVNFQNSPTLSAEFFRLNYTLDGTTHRPRITEDVLKTYSWIMRAYPIGGAVGENFKPRLWDVDGGTQLGNWVNTTAFECILYFSGPDDDIQLCASYFTNGWLFYYRIATMFGALNVGLNANAFYYGMISDGSGNFPRGQAMYAKTSVGPSGTPCSPFGLGCGWDTDGSYADWYAGHEIGHSLGRAHPNPGSDDPTTDAVELCGHSRSDPGFPYGNTSTASAPIGPGDGSMEGFDVGDPSFSIDKAVLPSATWNDLMSYCSNQWISDYTYAAMYTNMINNPSVMAAAVAPAVSGDFLAVAGVINPEGETAGFSFLRRLADVVNIPPLTPGAYAIRLLGAESNVLATYPFTPEAVDEAGGLGFSQVVDFVAGTRAVQIVRTSDNKVLGSAAVSPNPPVISHVALQGAPDPVSGIVTLVWTASDADGDPLTFDIAYSRDSGVTFQPVSIHVTGDSAQIDTAQLGGSGTAVLRVTASDGINSAQADSAAFVMAPKPPQPYILSPANNTQIHYGQLVNFSAVALDAQDGVVDAGGLVWTDEEGTTLGTGPLLSLEALPVGANVITLTATNSVNASASATVTVLVDDDLTLPGATLTVAPAQVGWHIAAGVTDAQTALLSINNAGSGNLDWTAASDQAWLTVSAISGTVSATGDPAALTLTADPTGLAANQTHVAHVTVTRPAIGDDPEQTIVALATLSIGDVRNVPVKSSSGSTDTSIFLPVIRR
jgi:hypothetical protein